jgi:tetratricopeptide (TPR) repeat protein
MASKSKHNAPPAQPQARVTSQPMGENRLLWLLGAAIVLAGLATFWGVARCDFLNYDDKLYVTENSQVLSGISLRSLAWAFTSGAASNWHPLTWISHMLDIQMFGMNASASHLVNLGFHLANSVLVLVWLRRLTQNICGSALVAALFCLHPMHVQSVAWVSERKDVLSGFFGLLTLLAYAAYVRSNQSSVISNQSSVPGSGDQKSKIKNQKFLYALTLLFFTLGLMSKPMLVTWPFLLLLLDFWPLRRMGISNAHNTNYAKSGPYQQSTINYQLFQRLLIEKLPFFALSIISSVVTFCVQRSSGAMPSLRRLPVLERIGNALVAYGRYLGKAIWPLKLSVFYPHPGAWPAWQILLAVLLVAGISVAAFWRMRKYGFLFTGWFWFLGTLVPVIGIVQVGEQSIADRYSYLPYIGLFIVIVWTALRLLKDRAAFFRKAAGAVSILLLGACAYLSHAEVEHWRSTETLFRHALAVTANNEIAEFNLANALIDSGNIPEGTKHLENALRISPSYAEAYGKLGYLYNLQGNPKGGVEQYHKALDLRPELMEALNNLAWLRATCSDPKLRDPAEAVRCAERACELSGFETTIYIGTLAAAYAEAGRMNDAIATAQKARDHALRWKEKDLAEKNEQLLEIYRSGRAYHEMPPAK